MPGMPDNHPQGQKGAATWQSLLLSAKDLNLRHIYGFQVSVGLSGYVLAAPWSGATANYSYPLYADVGASVQDHFLNWKVQTHTPRSSG